LEGKAIEEIRVLLEWEEECWVGTTSFGVVGLADVVLTLAAAFFFGFPAAGLGSTVDLGCDSLDLAMFLVAAT
jgi:hypothetical protein